MQVKSTECVSYCNFYGMFCAKYLFLPKYHFTFAILIKVVII